MRLKKLISGVLAGLTAISSIPFSSAGVIASAADDEKDIWDGTTDTSWYNSEEKEFHISTPEELAGLAELVNDGKRMSGQTFVLDNDIYLNDVSDFENWSDTAPENVWTPIGTSYTYYFSGIFDGSGFSIEGLYISGSDYQYSGLFGYTTDSSEINSTNTKYECINNRYLKGFAFSGGITAYSNGKISNCSTDAISIVKSYSPSAYSYGGGVAGYSTAEINNCTNSGIIISSSSSFPYGGGIAGISEAKISNCKNNGSVTSFYCGGISGRSTAEIVSCTNNGSITSSNYGGGISGISGDKISNCANNGSITSSNYGGGIAGISGDKISNCANNGNVTSSSNISSCGGGIAGFSTAEINNCANNGNINSSFYAGGIVGECSAEKITISNVYNTGDVSAKDYEGGIVGYNYMYNSSCKVTITNTYNVGKVLYPIAGSDGFTIINSSYLVGQSKYYSDDEEITVKNRAGMQTKDFAESLGDAFVYIAGNYPKLAWEVNNSKKDPTESISNKEKEIWDGNADTLWYDSEETEFHISTPEELAGLAKLVNSGKSMSGQTFVLDNDIYLNKFSDFEN